MVTASNTDHPTITGDMEKYATQFLEACQGSVVGTIGGTMRQFLKQDGLPPYYQVKANIVLSAADEENEPWENLAACKHYLSEAENALKTAKETYVHDAEDAGKLEYLEGSLKEEWVALRAREKAADSSDDE